MIKFFLMSAFGIQFFLPRKGALKGFFFFSRLCLSIPLVIGCQSDGSKGEANKKVFEEKIYCVGSGNAKNSIVYLHGYTGKDWNSREKRNLKNLGKIASRMDAMIAIPMSKKTCHIRGIKQRCWGVEMSRRQALGTLKVAARAAEKCFPPKSNYGIIGFSNGGYMATKVFGYCLAPQYAPRLDWIVTVGAAKLWGSGSSRSNLRSCLPITLVAGKRDKYNYERRQNKFRLLRRKGAKVSVLLFDGGHEVPYGPLITALRKYLK